MAHFDLKYPRNKNPNSQTCEDEPKTELKTNTSQNQNENPSKLNIPVIATIVREDANENKKQNGVESDDNVKENMKKDVEMKETKEDEDDFVVKVSTFLFFFFFFFYFSLFSLCLFLLFIFFTLSFFLFTLNAYKPLKRKQVVESDEDEDFTLSPKSTLLITFSFSFWDF